MSDPFFRYPFDHQLVATRTMLEVVQRPSPRTKRPVGYRAASCKPSMRTI